MNAEANFVRQQGFADTSANACALRYPALMWQPRMIAALVVAGVALGSGTYFFALGALLWWSAAVPHRNPFEALYNRLVARPSGRPTLGPAPSPRRFAQGMAGTFMLSIGIALLGGSRGAAWLLEGLLLAAIGALTFGRFCLGSYVFHLTRGHASFANRTLPWSPTD